MGTPEPSDPPVRRSPAWLGAGLVILLVALALRLLPDGHEHGRLPQFLGRFHPALVHFPIALLLLVPILELAGAFPRWAHLRKSAGLILGLAAAGALFSALDGWLLAWSGGYSGPIVIQHLWGGVVVAGLSLICAELRMRFVGRSRTGFTLIYVPLLLGTVAATFWTGEQGGKIAHGDNFLTEFMPSRLRGVLGVPPPPAPRPAAANEPAAKATFFTARIAPIFEKSCVSCHNPKKMKAKLLLTTYEGLMRGSEDGSVVVPWYPGKSELVRRVTLAPDDDDFMPNNGKNPLSAEDIKLIEQWIATGASAAQPVDSGS